MLKSTLGGRLLMLLSPDANTDSASSTESDEKGQESSTEQQAEEEQSETSDEQTNEEETTEDSKAATEANEEETSEEEEKTDEQAPPPVVDKPEDAKLDFHNHPRFQELIKEKNAVKEEVEQLRPLAERARVIDQYVAQNNISAARLQTAFEYAAAIENNPAKAFELIKPIYQKLAEYMGEVIPQDLAAEVAAGTLSSQRAQEIARARGEQQHQQYRQQNQGMTVQQQQEQLIQGSIDAWAHSTMKIDPDLRPKAAPDAVDGKWEYLDKTLRSMRFANPPRTVQEAQRMVEAAYKETNRFFGSFRTKATAQKRPLQDKQSNKNASRVIKTEKDVVAAVMHGMKPHQMSYK